MQTDELLALAERVEQAGADKQRRSAAQQRRTLMTEHKPSPDAVRTAGEVLLEAFGPHPLKPEITHRAALVIDRALRPAAVPGDMVEAVARALDKAACEAIGYPQPDADDDIDWRAFIPDATAALTTMQPALQAAVEALEKAEKVFLHYADLHRGKGTPDGDQKSAVNLAYSMEMGEALTTLQAAVEAG